MALPEGFTLEQPTQAAGTLNLPAGFKLEPKSFNAYKMIMNAPSSLYKNTIGGLYEAVSSPLQTGQALADVIAGGAYNVLPKPFQRGLAAIEASPYNPLGNPAALQRAQNVAGAVGKDYATTYGTGEGFQRTMEEDPFRVVGDLSMFLGGSGAMAKAANISPSANRAANMLTQASNVINPVNALLKTGQLVTKGVPQLTASGIGLLTTVGGDTVKEGFKAGLKGKTAFKENVTGNAPITQVLNDARANLAQINANKQADYRSGMVNITNDKAILDFTGIDNALTNAEKYSKFKGKIVNETADNLLTSIQKTVNDWKQSNPADFHTPEGLDQLKQAVWGEIEKLPQGSNQAYSAGKDVYNAIKSEISAQSPTYANVMKEYTDASELIHEIERSLSLGKKASADTALRKLQSLTRNNVNTNYGQRQALAQQLVEGGGNELMPALAGQAMSSWTPRGLAGQGGALGAGLAAFSNPYTAAVLPFMSPRLMGEAVYGAGRIGAGVNALAQPIQNALAPTIANAQRLASRVPMTAEQAKMLALIAAKAGNIPRLEASGMTTANPTGRFTQ